MTWERFNLKKKDRVKHRAIFFLKARCVRACRFIGVWWSLVGAVIGADQWRGEGATRPL